MTVTACTSLFQQYLENFELSLTVTGSITECSYYLVEFELSLTVTGRTSFVSHSLLLSAEFTLTATDIFCVQIKKRLVRVAPDCNRSYCEDSFSGYSGSV